MRGLWYLSTSIGELSVWIPQLPVFRCSEWIWNCKELNIYNEKLIWLFLGVFVLLSFEFLCEFSRLQFLFYRFISLALHLPLGYRWVIVVGFPSTVGLLQSGQTSCTQVCITGSAFSSALLHWKIRIWFILAYRDIWRVAPDFVSHP